MDFWWISGHLVAPSCGSTGDCSVAEQETLLSIIVDGVLGGLGGACFIGEAEEHFSAQLVEWSTSTAWLPICVADGALGGLGGACCFDKKRRERKEREKGQFTINSIKIKKE